MEYQVTVKNGGDFKIIKTVHVDKNNKDLIEFFQYLIKTGKTDRYYDNHNYGYVPILGIFPCDFNFSLSWKYYDGKTFLQIQTNDGKTDLMSLEDAIEIGKKIITTQ